MASCEHASVKVTRACAHVLAPDATYTMRFSGRGKECAYVCTACRDVDELVDICARCEARVREASWDGIVGEPGIVEVASPVRLAHVRVGIDASLPRYLAIAPMRGCGDRAVFVALAADHGLYRWDVDRGDHRRLAVVPADAGVDLAEPILLIVSRDGRLAAIANRRGVRAVVIDLVAGVVTLPLVRDDYQNESCDFSLAFVARGGRDLIVHAPQWNRLDVVDARTGENLTPRVSPAYERDQERPPHYLDYFHCGLVVSPDQRSIVDNGWVWHPVGEVIAWSLERWLADNVWESEDGSTRKTLAWRTYFWDGPLCWLDDARVALYGYGQDSEWLVPSACIHDTRTGELVSWFPGPRGEFIFDRVLFDVHDERGTALWDVERGARLAIDPMNRVAYHPDAKRFVTLPTAGAATATAVCGLASDAPWTRGVASTLARTIARDRAFADLPVLGDALEQAGCTDAEVLDHCRAPGEHGDRCWVLDRLGS